MITELKKITANKLRKQSKTKTNQNKTKNKQLKQRSVLVI